MGFARNTVFAVVDLILNGKKFQVNIIFEIF